MLAPISLGSLLCIGRSTVLRSIYWGAVAMVEARLQGARFFEFLTEEEREEFAEDSELVTFEPGETIIEEGGEPGSLFVLTSGRVEVSKSITGGRERLLGELEATSER